MEYTVTINQFNDGPTGHINLTFQAPGIDATYGANLSPSSGVQMESNVGRTPLHTATFSLTQDQFNSAYNFAVGADLLNNQYFGLGNNCYDFVEANLAAIGITARNFLAPNTLIATYAGISAYLGSSEYVDLGVSNVLNILASPENVFWASEFVSHMSWLGDHANGSDFYMDSGNYNYRSFEDPDAEADYRFALLQALGERLGIHVRKDPLQQKVILGVASPIVIDMNGDGINTVAFSDNPVLFDIDGDSVKDRTAWTDGTDGFLCVDINQNGIIDGVNEMFGGLNRGDGYAKLSSYDSNSDGLVNHADSGFSSLSVWIDKNADGVTDAGELVSVGDASLDSISVDYISQEVFQNFNLIGEVSDAVVAGQSRAAADVYFRYESGVTGDNIDAQVQALISAMSSTFVEAEGAAQSYDLNIATVQPLTVAAV